MKTKPRKPAAPAPLILPVGEKLPLPAPLRKVLGEVRSRRLLIQIAEGLCRIGIVWPSLWLVQALADWLFILPWTVRAIFLAVDAAVIGYLAFRYILRPLFHPLSTQSAALLIERSMPQFRSELISAVQLAAGGPGCVQGSVELVHRLLHRVANKIGHLDVARRVVTTVQLRRLVKIFVLVLLVTAGVAAGFYPKSLVQLQRILLSSAPLPTQTQVFPISGDLEVSEGMEASVSARAEGVIPKSGRIIIAYEDGRKETVTVQAGEKGVFAFTVPNVRQPFRYHFEVGDGVGAEGRVTTRVIPAVTATRYTQLYPAYTGRGEVPMSSGGLTLLVGGKLRIEGDANQPLRAAKLTLEGANTTQNLELVEGRGFRGEIAIPSENLTGLSVQVENEKGELSQPVRARVELRRDNAPIVSLIVPKTEKLTAQANARIPIVYSMKDDFGVTRAMLQYEVFRPKTPDQEELPPEKGEVPLPLPPGGSTAPQAFTWDLGMVLPAFTIGSVVRFHITVEDNNSLSGPGRAESRPRTMTIVSDEEKRLELLEAFGQTANKVEGLLKTQDKINKTTGSAIKSNP